MFRVAVREMGWFLSKLTSKDTEVSGSFAPGFIKVMAALRLKSEETFQLDLIRLNSFASKQLLIGLDGKNGRTEHLDCTTVALHAPYTSLIIGSLDDILRNQSLKVLMVKESPMYEQFKDASRLSKYGKIFQIVSQYESSFNEIENKDKLGKKLRSDMYRRDSVLIETTDALKLLAESTCWSNPNEGNFSISSEKFLSVHVTPVYGKNLSSAKRSFLDMRVYRAFESGLTSFIYQKYATSLKSTLEDEGMLTSKIAKALKKCIISDLQLYISELQKALHLDQMSNQALIGLRAMTAAGLAVATAVAVVEIWSPKGKTAHG